LAAAFCSIISAVVANIRESREICGAGRRRLGVKKPPAIRANANRISTAFSYGHQRGAVESFSSYGAIMNCGAKHQIVASDWIEYVAT